MSGDIIKTIAGITNKIFSHGGNIRLKSFSHSSQKKFSLSFSVRHLKIGRFKVLNNNKVTFRINSFFFCSLSLCVVVVVVVPLQIPRFYVHSDRPVHCSEFCVCDYSSGSSVISSFSFRLHFVV